MSGQDRTLVTSLDAVRAPGLKGSWREFEALHHVAVRVPEDSSEERIGVDAVETPGSRRDASTME